MVMCVCVFFFDLNQDHRNHTFEKLSVAYGRRRKKIRGEAAGLRRRRKELSVLIASVDKNIENVLKSKDDSAAELQMAFKRMQARLEEQLKCKLLALLAQKGSMTQEMELLDTILHELDQQLNSIPKSDLIAQEPHMSRMLQGIQTRTFSDISPTPISPDFTSEVVPAYEYGELVIKNYKMHLSQIRPTMFHLGSSNNNNSPRDLVFSKDVVFSEPVCASGVAWRLKVTKCKLHLLLLCLP
jgi:tripartite motif-containing protein 37